MNACSLSERGEIYRVSNLHIVAINYPVAPVRYATEGQPRYSISIASIYRFMATILQELCYAGCPEKLRANLCSHTQKSNKYLSWNSSMIRYIARMLLLYLNEQLLLFTDLYRYFPLILLILIIKCKIYSHKNENKSLFFLHKLYVKCWHSN